MYATQLKINGNIVEVKADDDTPLLWVLRDTLGLTGTKFGCGRGLCGCCTVLINGQAARSCLVPVGAMSGLDITTIEGLAQNPDHPVLKAWREVDVPQCGYCQPGQIMSAASLLNQRKAPTDEEIDATMSGVLCRCGTYVRIRAAIHEAARIAAKSAKPGTQS